VLTPGAAPPGVPFFAVALLGTTLLVIGVTIVTGIQDRGNPAIHFHEHHRGTYYSGALLVAGAAVALGVAWRLRGSAFARFWLVACVGLLYLAADEVIAIHEDIDRWVHGQLGWRADDPLTDHLDDLIVVLYAVAALGWAYRYRDALLRLRWTTLLLSIAGSGFAFMTVLDLFDVSKTLEESVKLLTEALIVVGVYAAARDPALGR
jgi:hypothetical protein